MEMTKTQHRQRTPSMGTIGRKERFAESRHDPYMAKQKWPEASQCRTCGAVFAAGRWMWAAKTDDPPRIECPACRRVADNCPAGIVDLQGAFVRDRGDEIKRIVSNVEASQRAEHPLERTMSLQVTAEGDIRIETTGIHLARRIGDALESAYGGDLNLTYGDKEYSVRIVWTRD